MNVTFIYGDGRKKEFEKVKSITSPRESMVILEFEEGHNYPANEVYVGFDSNLREFKVSLPLP